MTSADGGAAADDVLAVDGVGAADGEDGPPKPPAALLALRDGLPAVVTTQAQLDASIAALAVGSGPLAVDAERASGYRYSQRAYLIQLRRAGAATVLIDPAPFGGVPNDSLATLGATLADAEWVIHAASQDLACLAEVGMTPRHLFDTELAGRLLNYPRVGLAVLVEELLGFSMRKEHSAVDWSRRPMPDSWLRYAALDVELLVELRHRLAEQLEVTGKAEWARQEFAARAQITTPVARVDPWRRTAGIHRVRGRRGLAIVRSMWQLRDEIARARDIAPSKVLRDDAIVTAAQAAPPTRSALSVLDGFVNRSAQRYVKEFSAAIKQALELPDAQLPPVSQPHDGPPPARAWSVKFPAAAARLGACRELVTGLAAELDLPQENLLGPDAVRRLAWAPPDEVSAATVADALASYGARPWQVELTAEPLAAALTEALAEAEATPS